MTREIFPKRYEGVPKQTERRTNNGQPRAGKRERIGEEATWGDPNDPDRVGEMAKSQAPPKPSTTVEPKRAT